jgi:CheY-like chemotaxis protein/GNAT superfamily N-acetyltransferase
METSTQDKCQGENGVISSTSADCGPEGNNVKLPTFFESPSPMVNSAYPSKYIQDWQTTDGRNVMLRPICAEDESLEREFLNGLSPNSSRNRFLGAISEIPQEMVSRFCHIDYDCEMALIAEHVDGGRRQSVALCQLIPQSHNVLEYAVVVADDFQNVGLGHKLSELIIAIGREKAVKSINGFVLNDNHRMLRLARRLGFSTTRISDKESRIALRLQKRKYRVQKRVDCPRCKVLIVDDHSIFRDGIRTVLSLIEDIDVVGEASDGNEAISKVGELNPDVVLMDIALPGMDGLEASRHITKEFPDVKFLLLSQHDGKEFVIQAVKDGTAGYLAKGSALGIELLSAMRTIINSNKPKLSSTGRAHR